jgi:two-component system phosphate regulon sensor histidine kinase PhoR
MDEGMIASVSVGMAIFLALILLASGAGVGWFAARTRQPHSSDANRNHPAQISALLDAIPQAALIADSEARVRAQNARAVQLMNEVRWDAGLPSMLDAAIGRVSNTGLAETMELVATDKPARRLQVAITPLEVPDEEAMTLILLTDPADGSYRAELYQRLVSTIAHELRTPLTAIMGHVEILNSCGIDEETLWHRSLGFVAGETDRLARLVEDLLSLSRLDRVPLRVQPVNLRVAAEEAVSALFDLAEKNNASPILQAPTDLPRVLADPDRIRQVFLNLLDNAIKYASNNPVTVRLIPNADAVRIEVNNRGPAIAPEDLPHIFEPFWRGKQTNAGGTGLGLAIVRAILEQHRTSIGVNSEAGQGTTFHFSLPIARPAETR